MLNITSCRAMFHCIVLAVASSFAGHCAFAGPPFMSDDPEPTEYKQSEAYLFANIDKGPNGSQRALPALEYNTSPLENLQLHVVVPYAHSFASGLPAEHGLGDVQLGANYRFVQEGPSTPMMSIFPLVDFATGDADRGLGNGRTWARLPLWLQKSFGRWTAYGGGGRAFNPAPDMPNFNYAGLVLQRSFSDKGAIGGELFSTRAGSVDNGRALYMNIGAYYEDINACNCGVLFRAGHTIAGEPHARAYIALHWTWGGEQGMNKTNNRTPFKLGADPVDNTAANGRLAFAPFPGGRR